MVYLSVLYLGCKYNKDLQAGLLTVAAIIDLVGISVTGVLLNNSIGGIHCQ